LLYIPRQNRNNTSPNTVGLLSLLYPFLVSVAYVISCGRTASCHRDNYRVQPGHVSKQAVLRPGLVALPCQSGTTTCNPHEHLHVTLGPRKRIVKNKSNLDSFTYGANTNMHLHVASLHVFPSATRLWPGSHARAARLFPCRTRSYSRPYPSCLLLLLRPQATHPITY
jgi:hypothetical protein